MIKTIIIGSLNTDLLITGANKLLDKGESTLAENFSIAAGGKSRNIAAMLATLQQSGSSIAFIGKTIKDKLGLWKYPIESLKDLGIDISQIQILKKHPRYDLPGLAIIPIDKEGHNQIYLVPGIREDFNKTDMEKSEKLFEEISRNNGIVAITLEMPLETAIEAIKLSKKYNLKVIIDPGGIEGRPELIEVVKMGGFLIKPNEHEAKILTGIQIENFDDAHKAAKKILAMGFEYVLITHGKYGSYLFGKDLAKKFEVPESTLNTKGSSVGCGDQTMAGFIFSLMQDRDIVESAEIATIAGAAQFTKAGITPISLNELNSYLKNKF